jgi:hypothetical protein
MQSFQIDYFLALAEYKSFSRTAEHLFFLLQFLRKTGRNLER